MNFIESFAGVFRERNGAQRLLLIILSSLLYKCKVANFLYDHVIFSYDNAQFFNKFLNI